MLWILLLVVVLVGLTVLAVRVYQREEAMKLSPLANNCRKCGAGIETPNPICPYCGFDVYDGFSYCPKCGGETLEGQKMCTNCNASLSRPTSKEENSTLGFVSFLIPLVGFILYAVLYESQPAKAKSALNGALLGLFVGGFIVFFFVFLI